MISSVDLGVNAKKHTFSNLKPGSYTVKVFDNNCCEKVFVAYVKCAPPSSGFVTTNITTTSARLNWDIVNCAIGYRVQYRKLGDTTWTTTSINSNIGKKNLYLLQPNTTYEWHVATKCIGALSFPVYGPSVNQLFATAALKSGQLQDAYFTELFDIIIKPNPASKIITVNFETGNSTAVLKVINTMGQTVFEKQLIGDDGIYEEQLDVSRFINGIYFLVVETENGVSRGKFVKE
ncbi:MAG: T9SS type A sorting domain-containing protein [Bacteroidetes bacterium]|nr:T9SS type A sorting domain-containing protein [Bacteroidota bacterium]